MAVKQHQTKTFHTYRNHYNHFRLNTIFGNTTDHLPVYNRRIKIALPVLQYIRDLVSCIVLNDMLTRDVREFHNRNYQISEIRSIRNCIRI